jgi:hypothetical protein
VKEFLSRAGVDLVVKDVMEDLDAYDELLAMGYRTIPVTVAGEQRIVGFDHAALQGLVASLGR